MPLGDALPSSSGRVRVSQLEIAGAPGSTRNPAEVIAWMHWASATLSAALFCSHRSLAEENAKLSLTSSSRLPPLLRRNVLWPNVGLWHAPQIGCEISATSRSNDNRVW